MMTVAFDPMDRAFDDYSEESFTNNPYMKEILDQEAGVTNPGKTRLS